MKRNHILSLCGAIIIALIVFVIALPNKNNTPTVDIPEDLPTFASSQDFVSGDMQYSFDTINWDLNLIEAGSARVPETRVGFFFENFTRHENALAASFASPFHIGLYRGDCVELQGIPDNTALDSIEGAFIAGVVCMWEGEAAVVLLAQNENLVTVYDVYGQDPSVVNTIRVIDITTIVQ